MCNILINCDERRDCIVERKKQTTFCKRSKQFVYKVSGSDAEFKNALQA